MATERSTRGLGRPKAIPRSNPSPVSTKNYLLVIGIDEYDVHHGRLKNCKNDCERLVDELKRRYQGFHDLNITKRYNKEATREEILDLLEGYKQNLSANDNLVIYYAGHGEYDSEEERSYWIPYGAQANSHFISSDDIKNKIRGIDARHVVLVVDTCFGARMMDGDRNQAEHKFARRALFSGYEKVKDGFGEHSPFAEALLLELTRNNADSVRFSTLAQVVVNYTKNSIEKRNAKPRQMPSFRVFLGTNVGEDFVLELNERNLNIAMNKTEQSPSSAPIDALEELGQTIKENKILRGIFIAILLIAIAVLFRYM